MVRNTPSMQSLRPSSSVADLSTASQQADHRPTPAPYTPITDPSGKHPWARPEAVPSGHEQKGAEEKLQRLDQQATLQLRGQDPYTKEMMTKMAMGKATPAEQAAFHERVREARYSPMIKNLVHSTSGEEARSSKDAPATELSPIARAAYEQLQEALDALNIKPSAARCRGRLPNPLSEYKFPQQQTIQQPTIQQATHQNASKYTKPFCDFLTDNPTVFHAVSAMKKDLKDAGWTELSERDAWDIKPSGSYFVERNGSSLIAFSVGANYKSGNGAAILAGHVDALTARLKPISTVPNKAGYLQLGVAPYAGGLNSTWWDRDLGIGGRVHIKEGDKIVTKLVKLDWPIARIPTLAPHFGAAAQGPFNPETQMVPIIGLDTTSAGPYQDVEPFSQPSLLRGANGSVGSFVHTQPPALVKVIAEALELSASNVKNIVNWELELFDVQPATIGGLNKEFIYAGRIDDKLCSWAALQALIESQPHDDDSSIIKVVGLFDDEEIGSLLRQGARGNFLPTVVERAVGSLADHKPTSDLMGRTYANSFLVSSDVTHAVNPNFLNAYLENHAPHLNVGVAVAADSNGHMTTDSVSTSILQRCAEKADAKLQVFQIRNDSRSGGTVGPMLSSALGVRAIDAGLPQLSMHSIRATTGALDPGLGVILFAAFLGGFESVDKEFR